MSHILEQVGAVSLRDLGKLERACKAVFEQELNCRLKLDLTQKTARYYRGATEECDGVITFDRALTEDEQDSYYEIGLRRRELEGNKFDYVMLADTNATDRKIKDRLNRIQAYYHVEEKKAQGIAQGYVIGKVVEHAPGDVELVLQRA